MIDLWDAVCGAVQDLQTPPLRAGTVKIQQLVEHDERAVDRELCESGAQVWQIDDEGRFDELDLQGQETQRHRA